ncbi:helix-turn-helix transcriptional regulator [Roseibium sp. MMSF_3544]|uniref:ArsR/SmtB family transcription factor n=1 Tax=unclassified Roseibium TaxID=2629323 RepID=UPI00273E74C4|nr:metalloregulator ArsR/SmtB family transcription factor [Roseibium sp. MMSF_3544]
MSVTDCPPSKSCAEPGTCLDSCEELAAIFRALGHPARLAIIKQLAVQDEACCGEIVNHLPLAQSTVSQHLQVLKDAGLLDCDARGRNCHYLLNREKLRRAELCSIEFFDRLNSLQPVRSVADAEARADTE